MPPTPPGRRFSRRLAGLCLIGLLLEALGRWLEWPHDPFARVPLDDAQAYWEWAGAIAGGRLIGSEPFLSAPLYPFFLALLRALGFGLPGIYAVQALLHAATGWLVGRAARHRLATDGPALAAAALFLLLTDPSYAAGRLLNSSLQLFLVALLWRGLQRAEDRPGGGRDLGLGALLGLNALANPAMLLAVPIVAAWRGRRTSWPAAPRLVLAAALVVAPATAHNLAACGEPILISAQAGVTFAHGNAPGADGTYHPIPGVSTGRLKQNRDAWRLTAEETGIEGWRATSRHFFARGLAWWAADPGAALLTAARKVGLFFTAHAYGDVALPELERQAGLQPWAGIVPAPLVLLPALLALFVAWRRRRPVFPEALLLLLPLLVVTLFFYSPRYRMPALPVAAALCAGVAAQRHRWRGAIWLGGLLALAAGGALEPPLDRLRPAFAHKLGEAWERAGEPERAEAAYRRAAELSFPQAAASLARLRSERAADDPAGLAEALAELRRAAEARPEDPYGWRALATALARSGRAAEAEAPFRRAVELDPGDWEALAGLGGVLLETGRPEEAVTELRRAVAARPDSAPAWFNLAQAELALDHEREATEALEEALRHDPGLAPARLDLLRIRAGARTPELRDPDRAAELAAELEADLRRRSEPTPREVVEVLEARAMAAAAGGHWSEAGDLQDQAAEVAAATGAPEEVVSTLRAQAEAYRKERPFRR
ncbi:MAG: tetratricopeptide repeat protein [Planctomycetota bacterium]|nr:MAG: tetratricopeptide repeat protein [Planctomycetota bacterium]